MVRQAIAYSRQRIKFRTTSISWFWLGVGVIFLLSLVLRFWGLKRFNTFVFDEVTYVKHAYSYLTRGAVYDAHPPLGKYLIAIAIWIDTHTSFTDTPKTITDVAQLSSWSYRWLNALAGSFIPPLAATIVYQISHRPVFALTAGFFTALDGLLLVESRYALINIYLILFGLAAQSLLLLALVKHSVQRYIWLTIAGITFGLAASVKWSGLWFLLGIYFLWGIMWALKILHRFLQKKDGISFPSSPESGHETDSINPLQNLTQLNHWHVGYYLGLIPVNVYLLLWIPHLPFNPGTGLIELHRQILAFHKQMPLNAHPDCSSWYSWLGMVHHVLYWHKRFKQNSVEMVNDIHAMGNPILWWFSTVAVVVVCIALLWRLRPWFLAPIRKDEIKPLSVMQTTEFSGLLYIVSNYAANLLPWVGVPRCTFVYHYMSASIFAFMALAWIVDRFLRSHDRFLSVIGTTIILIIIWAFIFWMPMWYGLTLTYEQYDARRWLSSW